MPSNGPAILGREAIRKWFEAWLTAPGTSVTFSPESIEVSTSGDIAFERGAYALLAIGPHDRTEDTGKYLSIWRKLDGHWQVIVDTSNSNKPCPGQRAVSAV